MQNLEIVSQLELKNKELQEENDQLRASLQHNKEDMAIEEKHKQSETRFRTVFEQSFLGNKIISSDLRIRQINSALVTLLGYNKEDLLGKSVVNYTHPDFRDKWDILRHNLWDKKIPSFQVEICLIKKDGKGVWCLITSILFEDNKDTFGYTIVEDISDRKKLEEENKRFQDAQEAIIYTVAHDLKNPILTIKGLTDLLHKDIEHFSSTNKETLKRSLSLISMINGTSDKTFSILEDLLLVGELERGNMEKEMTGLKHLTESSLAIWRLTAEKKGVQIDSQITEEVYAPVNRERIGRVLDNLLSNAIKFSHKGERIEVRLKQQAQKVVLQVSDSGIGIPESLQATVFDKFTKANRKGTSGESTTGLGLFIAKRIIELHQGHIWIESQQNQGSTFHIELPMS